MIVIGGNGSLRGAAQIAQASGNICVIGVPKTIDNDIPATDRCPGFASAARHAAQSVRDLGMDVRTLPQPVSIFETMGRSAGWLAGATALARLDESHAPHLVYVPERVFHVEQFIADVDRIVTRHGWAVAVVSEGVKDREGRPVFESSDSSQRDAMNRAVPGGGSIVPGGCGDARIEDSLPLGKAGPLRPKLNASRGRAGFDRCRSCRPRGGAGGHR